MAWHSWKQAAESGERSHKGSFGWAMVAAVSLCFTAPALDAFDITPFNANNQSPIVQIYGLPRVENALLLLSGQKTFQATLDHSSNNVDESNSRERILLDGETTRITFSCRYGLSEKWELGIEIPYILHGGGFLDGFLIDYHDLFGFPQGGRDQAPRNRLLYRYSRDGVEKLKVDGSGSGPGDVSLSAGLQLYNDGRPHPLALALRGKIKLPTGDSDTLHGSSSIDGSLSIAASNSFLLPLGHGTVFTSAGLMAMTRGNVLPEQQQDFVGFGTIGAGWQPRSWIAFKVQLDGHTPFYRESALKALGANAGQLLIGGTLGLSERTTLDIAVSEDIVTTTSPDVAFHFNLTTLF
jgi:hypothetical protein